MLKPQDIVILLKILSVMVLNKNDLDEYMSQNKLATIFGYNLGSSGGQ